MSPLNTTDAAAPVTDGGLPAVHPAVMAFLSISFLVWCASCWTSVVFDIVRFRLSGGTDPGATDWTMGRIVFAACTVPAYGIFRELRARAGTGG